MMNTNTYQMIFDELSKFLSTDWEKIVVYVEYGEDSYSYSLYERIRNNYTNGYDLPGISEKEIDKSFNKIDKMIRKEREKAKGELWTNMTIVITNSGDMKAEYDYTDLTEGTYQYKKDWKKRYLK